MTDEVAQRELLRQAMRAELFLAIGPSMGDARIEALLDRLIGCVDDHG